MRVWIRSKDETMGDFHCFATMEDAINWMGLATETHKKLYMVEIDDQLIASILTAQKTIRDLGRFKIIEKCNLP